MRIVEENPPNFEEIKKHFDLSGKVPVFAYGDILYNPAGSEIQPHLLVHEEVHQKQQNKMGVKKWWAEFIKNPGFRLSQEMMAFIVQYYYVKKNFNGKAQKWFLSRFADDLSSPMYGNMITRHQAETRIRKGAETFR